MKPIPIKPNLDQESVWDYPRPPRLEKFDKRIRVLFNNITIVDTKNAYRVLETSHPPVYYVPPHDTLMQYLTKEKGRSICEWKGQGHYYSITVKGKSVREVAWFYPDPTEDFLPIKNYLAFYAGRVDKCFIEDEEVLPQPGNFYGGWITKNIVGPFKGIPGSMGW